MPQFPLTRFILLLYSDLIILSLRFGRWEQSGRMLSDGVITKQTMTRILGVPKKHPNVIITTFYRLHREKQTFILIPTTPYFIKSCGLVWVLEAIFV